MISIKDYAPVPYEGEVKIPAYIKDRQIYALIATVQGGYKVLLARLTIGDAHDKYIYALFESFDDHGGQMLVVKTRADGYDREFTAVKNAMRYAGIEFADVTLCTSEELLKSLGEWFGEHNADIEKWEIVSQSCH